MIACEANCKYSANGRCLLNKCNNYGLFEVYTQERLRRLWELR